MKKMKKGSIYVTNPTWFINEVSVYVDGKEYVYVGVSPPHFKEARFYASKGWRGKVFDTLKQYRCDWMLDSESEGGKNEKD